MAGIWVMAPAEYAPTGQKGAIYRRCWEYDLERSPLDGTWAKPRSQGSIWTGFGKTMPIRRGRTMAERCLGISGLVWKTAIS